MEGPQTGPLRMDDDYAGKVTEKTIERYRQAARVFSDWLEENRLHPETVGEWDDLLVEWKNSTRPSRSKFNTTVASIEFFFPRYQRGLTWSHQVAKGMARRHATRHARPMSRDLAALLGAHMSHLGYARLGLGMRLQQATGMRPSELLALRASEISVTAAHVERSQQAVIFALGTSRGTKVKRQQFCILRFAKERELAECVLRLRSLVEPHERLFPYTYSTYRRLIRECEEATGIELKLTPHSPRAGYATDGVLAGEDIVNLRASGRWNSEANFRIYVDVVAALATQDQVKLQGLAEAVLYCLQHTDLFFSEERLLTQRRHASRRVDQRRGRSVAPAGPKRAATQCATTSFDVAAEEPSDTEESSEADEGAHASAHLQGLRR